MVGFMGWAWSNAMVLKPIEESLPAIMGLLLAIAGPVVSKESVRGVGVEHDLRRAPSLLAGYLHFLDVAVGNALVRAAIEAQHGSFQARCDVERVSGLELTLGVREPAVPCDAGLRIARSMALPQALPDC
jgi:hypothetical protein